jgi:hypothetical protein
VAKDGSFHVDSAAIELSLKKLPHDEHTQRRIGMTVQPSSADKANREAGRITNVDVELFSAHTPAECSLDTLGNVGNECDPSSTEVRE